MAGAANDSILRYMRKLGGEGADRGVPDRELIRRFVMEHDEAAFELLLWRYAAMVRHVCRGVTRDHHDAEDAFQATFLVLARKAWSVRTQESLGGWLYRVAYRIAVRARSQLVRRAAHQAREVDLQTLPRPEPSPEAQSMDEWRPLLLEEVDRLPAKYRTPIVLCYLEGKTHEEAADQLGWPRGTVSGRLARARDLLRTRLVRRGLGLSGGALLEALSPGDAAALGPLLRRTVQTAALFASHKAKAASLIHPQTALLAEGMLRTMFVTKLKRTVALVVAALVLGSGAGGLACRLLAAPLGPGTAASTPALENQLRAPGKDKAKDKAIQKALKQLAGTWEVLSVESNGRKGKEGEVTGLTYVFETSGKWKLMKDDDVQAEGTFKIDPSKKPATIDYKIVSSIAADSKGKSSLGIYELNGDKLKVCRTWPDNDQRPEEFEAGSDSKCILTQFKRKVVSEKDIAELDRQIAAREKELSELKARAAVWRDALDNAFWKKTEPEKLGLDARAVKRHQEHAQRSGADAVLVVYKGRIVSEWYAATYKEPIYTMSSVKSWTGLLVGMLIEDGKIKSVDDPVSNYLPQWKEGAKAKVKLRHLLTMTSGLKRRWGTEPGPDLSVGFAGPDKNAFVLKLPLTYKPGERWEYSNEGVQLLSPLLDKAAGRPIQEYARDRLFKPVGMSPRTRLAEDARGHAWTYADAETTLRDFARIGVLMLNKGRWGDKQVVPRKWVRESLRPCPQNKSYGYLWWLLDDPPGFATKGYRDTNCYVFPSLDLVVVRMQNTPAREGAVAYEPAGLKLIKAIVPPRRS
jgi:RNA polymerase sigma factor (sigma-70 family)